MVVGLGWGDVMLRAELTSGIRVGDNKAASGSGISGGGWGFRGLRLGDRRLWVLRGETKDKGSWVLEEGFGV